MALEDKSVDEVGKVWAKNPYYVEAEQWNWVFWRDQSPFRKRFELLDLRNVVELACGHGRHTAHFVERAGHVSLLDIHQGNLDAAAARLAGKKNVSFHLGNGRSLRPIPDASVTAVFSYDSMVHFAPDVVASYLIDIKRVLMPGGKALLHHSNYAAPPGAVWNKNPHGRNYMTEPLFRQLASDAKLEVVEMHKLNWGEEVLLDCISLLKA